MLAQIRLAHHEETKPMDLAKVDAAMRELT